MATELGLTQPLYARIESEESNLTIKRLQQIADILKTDVSALVDASKITIQNQTNKEGAYGNGYIENLHVENKETQKKFIQSLEDNIKQLKDENLHLKQEVEFLRSLIKSSKENEVHLQQAE